MTPVTKSFACKTKIFLPYINHAEYIGPTCVPDSLEATVLTLASLEGWDVRTCVPSNCVSWVSSFRLG